MLERAVDLAARLLDKPRSSVWLQDRAGEDLVVRALFGYDWRDAAILQQHLRSGRARPRDPRRRRAVPARGGEVPRERAARSLARGLVGGRPASARRRPARLHRRTHRARRRRVRRPQHAPPGRRRAPGEARGHQRVELREPRADVPLDRRGARQRARGERRVHLLARALDHRHGPARRPRARAGRQGAQAPRARRPLPRHRQDRRPRGDPGQARPALRRGVEGRPAPPRARRAHPRARSSGWSRSARSSATATSTGTAAATRAGSPARRSRSSRASSSSATPTTR